MRFRFSTSDDQYNVPRSRSGDKNPTGHPELRPGLSFENFMSVLSLVELRVYDMHESIAHTANPAVNRASVVDAEPRLMMPCSGT
jgi:hypothetical protein